jgi:hypothetical protein
MVEPTRPTRTRGCREPTSRDAPTSSSAGAPEPAAPIDARHDGSCVASFPGLQAPGAERVAVTPDLVAPRVRGSWPNRGLR